MCLISNTINADEIKDINTNFESTKNIENNRSLENVNLLWQNNGLFNVAGTIWIEFPSTDRDYFDSASYCKGFGKSIGNIRLNGFRLPFLDEYRELQNKKYLKKYLHDWRYWTDTSESGKHPTEYKFVYNLEYASGSSYWTGNTINGDHKPFISDTMCVLKDTKIETLNRPFIDISEDIISKQLKQIKEIAVPIEPNLPLKHSSSNLLKGEFESREKFNQRISEDEQKIKIMNDNKEQQYQTAMKKWKEDVENLEKNKKENSLNFEKQKSTLLNDTLGIAVELRCGYPLIKSTNYDADKQQFKIDITSKNKNCDDFVYIPVKINHAPRIKEILSNPNFEPIVQMNLSNNKLSTVGILQLQNTNEMIAKDEFDKSKSIADLKKFINNYPQSSFVSSAKAKLNELQLQEAKEAKAKQNKINADNAAFVAKQKLYNQPKNIGDKVCLVGKTSGFLLGQTTQTISGFVEGKNSDRIQIRIADYNYVTRYNGTDLRQNILLWDQHYNWKKCH